MTETITWTALEDSTPPEEDWYLVFHFMDGAEEGYVHMFKWMNDAGNWGWYAAYTNDPLPGVTHWATRPKGPGQ